MGRGRDAGQAALQRDTPTQVASLTKRTSTNKPADGPLFGRAPGKRDVVGRIRALHGGDERQLVGLAHVSGQKCQSHALTPIWGTSSQVPCSAYAEGQASSGAETDSVSLFARSDHGRPPASRFELADRDWATGEKCRRAVTIPVHPARQPVLPFLGKALLRPWTRGHRRPVVVISLATLAAWQHVNDR